MPPPNFYRDRWPHPAPENGQNSVRIQASAQAASAPFPPLLPPHPQYRRSPQRMDGRAANTIPPATTRLRTGSSYDPYAAESEYGPYNFEENISFSVSVPSQRGSESREPGEYVRTRRDEVPPSEADWIFPNGADDRVTAQLNGRIEMLRQRIGAVERSREQVQRTEQAQSSGPEPMLPPAHQGIRWAYPAENRPGFWETGYGPHGARFGGPERGSIPARPEATSSGTPVRANVPHPVVVPPPESTVPPAPVTGHKVYVLNCKNCGMFLSNRGMKAVLLLRPNIALFSTDAMPVNCSPQPTEDSQMGCDPCERHPQDITHLAQGAQSTPPTNQHEEEILYARFFLPVRSEVLDKHPEALLPERSADLTTESRPIPIQSFPRTCECLTQTLSCHGCGAGIGYMIVMPCARCTAQQNAGSRAGQPQRTANGHRFVFHHAEIVARERLYVPGQPGVHRYPWGIHPTSDPPHSPTRAQQNSRSRVSSADSEPKSPSIPVFQPHRDGNFVPIVSPVPAQAAPTRRVQNTGLKRGDVVFWHHLGRTGELGGVSMADDDCARDYVER